MDFDRVLPVHVNLNLIWTVRVAFVRTCVPTFTLLSGHEIRLVLKVIAH